MRIFTALLAIALAALAADPAAAWQPPRTRPSGSDLDALPDYCQARFGEDQALRLQWSKQLGPREFIHIHHFCTGLSLIDRASRTTDKRTRVYFLQSAVGEFQYVLSRWPADFQLVPMARERQEEARMLLQLAAPKKKNR